MKILVMSLHRSVGITILVTIAFFGETGLVRAQSPDAPSDAPVQAGPLTLLPTFQLTNFGYDNNVFNTSVDSQPKGGVTATLSPVVEAWLRLEHARVSGRSKVDFYYFKDYATLNGVDSDTAVRVEVLLNRLAPYFTGILTDTRHRQGLEIDSLAKRRNESARAGAYLRLTENISVGGYAQRSRLEYESNSLYLGTDLARQLNHTSATEGVDVRYTLTPLTALSLGTEWQKDRFESSDNNAESRLVMSAVEFSPLALVSGRASIGFRSFRFVTGGLPEFKGPVAAVDLNYTLLGQTRFGVGVRRGLEFSYFAHDYLATEINVSVTERLGESWEVGGALGRARLAYGQQNLGTTLVQDETAHTFVADAGYRLNRAKIGFHVDYGTRQPDVPELFRRYQRLRIGSTLTYAF